MFLIYRNHSLISILDLFDIDFVLAQKFFKVQSLLDYFFHFSYYLYCSTQAIGAWDDYKLVAVLSNIIVARLLT